MSGRDGDAAGGFVRAGSGLAGPAPPVIVGQSQSLTGAALWLLVLIALVIVGAYVLFRVRRRLVSESDSEAPKGLTLQDLREMKGRGDISEEEYERARAIVIGDTKTCESGRVNPLTGHPRTRGDGSP